MRVMRRAAFACLIVAAAIVIASGVALAATLTGNEKDNTIDGTDSADTIDGKAGADTVRGKGGGDTIYGGEGRDKLYAVDESESPADDGGGNRVSGNEHDDTIVGGPGADELYGGRDNDTIDDVGGADTIYGGPNGDVIRTGPLEETDVDTVHGEEGNDTIYAANLPASKDVVGCGADTDKVIADSLDVVADNCEKVERIRETEPQLADGTYKLVPDPSSECDFDEGTFTVGNDPETGDRGVTVSLGGQVSPDGGAQACEVKIDYETPVSAQGEVSAESTSTRRYKGEKPPQAEIDAMKERAQTEEKQDAPSSTQPAQSGDITAQYAWRTNTARVVLQTIDPPQWVLAETMHRSTWWNNGYDVDYYDRGKYCWATPPGYFVTRWYNSYCNWGDWWYNYDSSRSWIGSDVGYAKYYNWGFWSDSKSTRSYHYTRIWGYNNGGYGYRYWYSDYGEAYWLIGARVFATPAGNVVGT